MPVLNKFAAMNFDVLMPTILFVVTLTAMFLGRKAESKLKGTVENREFKTRDTILLIAMIALAVSIVVFVPSMAILALFLFSYSSLLFTVSYAFSDMRPNRVTLYCLTFVVVSVLAAAAGLLGIMPADLRFYGVLAFIGLAGSAVFVIMFIHGKQATKQAWYVAALPPALFLLLFAFFGKTSIWFPYLLDVYGVIFALLIVIYMSSLFTWKTVFIFAGFLTALDIILVWGTGQMVQAANAISHLGLPVLVSFPTIPLMFSPGGAHAILLLNLGLGDFFFAGILTSQTLKKFGTKVAILSLATICISFGLFELILLNKQLYEALPVKALPATLPILLGWLPVIAIKMFIDSRKKRGQEPALPPE